MKNRLFNKLKAFCGSYFWLPCPMCGQYFGGHEWAGGVNPDGWGICPDCGRVEEYYEKMLKEYLEAKGATQ